MSCRKSLRGQQKSVESEAEKDLEPEEVDEDDEDADAEAGGEADVQEDPWKGVPEEGSSFDHGTLVWAKGT